ncbi:hypothetical protein ASD01_29565 [Ensifer sp. Root423]|uniref:hypothetical protein n=1 Tax=Ensifer sp. Root423 TaxID=1736534 RepID=UPI000714CDDA|nr:hypothetical protein [Ensifer sp. Root423]KQX20966.1 hypothetical protein ASD01_29565 [Ensifer sp. Root423]
MPRTGGVYSPPAGTKGTPNTTIQSVPYNTFIDDLTADANAARPITAGGTGSTTASGARTALGVAIGTNVQAYDAGLQSISGLTTAADQMLYTTALDTYATTALTPFARTLLDDANASTALTTLGVSTFIKTLLDDADAATARATLGANNASNLTTGTVADAIMNAATYNLGAVNMSGRLTLTGGGEEIRLVSASDTDDPYLSFWKGGTINARQGYVQHTDGAGLTLGMRMQNDVATGGALSVVLSNNGGVDAFRYIVGASNYAVWHTGNLAAADITALYGYTPANNGISIVAGNGITGGGTLAASRTLTLGTPTSVTNASTNSVTATSHTHELVLTAADLNGIYGYTPVNPTRQVIAGNGLTGGGTLAADRTLTLGTPGTLTATSANAVTTTSHTHDVDWGGGAASLGAGGIGTYVWAQRVGNTNGYAFGATISGANLEPASGISATNGVALSGTWRCMGAISAGATSTGSFAIWLRIS